VSESNVSELEITEAEGKVRIVKGPVGAPVVMAAPVSVAPPVASAPATAAPATPALSASAEAAVETGHTVKSPMVGTYYSASGPEAKPFVQVGSVVQAGDTICIIEAMKILNEIEADHSGTVSKILVSNGQAVEYGQPMFIID
jgi:acetyl-CoA carboxylase biotin carboxyl carrier protein